VLATGSPAGAGDLKPSAEPPIEVTIVGVAAPPVAAHDPSGASYALGEERLRAPGASAADVLAQVPGVQVARTGGTHRWQPRAARTMDHRFRAFTGWTGMRLFLPRKRRARSGLRSPHQT